MPARHSKMRGEENVNTINKNYRSLLKKRRSYLDLKACAVDKTIGPVGYTMGFLRLNNRPSWTFRSHDFLEKRFNATYITLSPKKSGAKELRDSRPSSLICNV